jgi:hypothetical protein
MKSKDIEIKRNSVECNDIKVIGLFPLILIEPSLSSLDREIQISVFALLYKINNLNFNNINNNE